MYTRLQDWDNYESGNWLGLLRWVDENLESPDLKEVLEHLHKSQEEYFRYEREFLGWGIYILKPRSYNV